MLALPTPTPANVPIAGIGASAGGIDALQELFRALPADLGLVDVVIVHLALDRGSSLPAIIATRTTMPVAQHHGTVSAEIVVDDQPDVADSQDQLLRNLG